MPRFWLLAFFVALTLATACSSGRSRSTTAEVHVQEPDRPQDPARGELVAEVDQLLMAHRVAPGESLAVRLLGSIGPDGSYVLESLDVETRPGHVVIHPRVRRQPGDAFISMVLPLDRTVKLRLATGRHIVEVGGLQEVVEVAAGALRPPPEVRIESRPPVATGVELVVPVEIEARAGDGFVDRIEVRERTAAGESSWRDAESTQRQDEVLRAWITIRRPAGDSVRTLEVRAVDGQGDVAGSRLVLEAR